MDASAIKAMMAEIAPVIREYVARETSPLIARCAALENQNTVLFQLVTELEAREMPDVSGFCDAAAVREIAVASVAGVAGDLLTLGAKVETIAGSNVAHDIRIGELEAREIPAIKGDPGEADMDAVNILVQRDVEKVLPVAVQNAVAKAIAELPPAEKGDSGVGVVSAEIRLNVLELTLSDGNVIAAGPVYSGRDGKDCDMAEVERMVSERVKAAVEALPPPKDGVGLANTFKDHDGCLILVMTDGSTRNLGTIDGKDGVTFTIDDFDIIPLDDERSFKFCFTRGEVMHSFEFAFPVVLDRGVWSEAREYVKGDAVSWAGSLWIAQEATRSKPDESRDGRPWRLAVKKGRDGRDAK